MKSAAAWLITGLLTMMTGSSDPNTAITPTPKPRPLLTMTGMASWYSADDPGVQPLTASGEPFDDTRLTCAAWQLPFDTRLHVTNLETGREVVVRVNDRGPARRLVAEGRVIDLSKEAFRQIAGLERGLVPVRVELLALD